MLVGAVSPKAKVLGVLEAFDDEVHDATFKLPLLNELAVNETFQFVLD